MPLIKKPEPLYFSATKAAEFLQMERGQFYASGLADWLDHWYEGKSRMYSKSQLVQMRYWLDVREGQIGLGEISPTSPILPPPYNGNLDAFVDDDLWGGECQLCGGFAVIHPDTGATWCKRCD